MHMSHIYVIIFQVNQNCFIQSNNKNYLNSNLLFTKFLFTFYKSNKFLNQKLKFLKYTLN